MGDAVTIEDLWRAVAKLKEANVPTSPGGFYYVRVNQTCLGFFIKMHMESNTASRWLREERRVKK